MSHFLLEDEVIEQSPEVDVQKKLQNPRMFQVILLNDDYTPMDFVVEVLVSVFSMEAQQAAAVMWQVHTAGQAVCGVYVHEIAETKVYEVSQLARQHEHPLRCIMQAVED